MLIVGHFSLCVRSHALRPLIWPESLRRTSGLAKSCDLTHKAQCLTISNVLIPLHPQSLVKHTTWHFQQKFGRCVLARVRDAFSGASLQEPALDCPRREFHFTLLFKSAFAVSLGFYTRSSFPFKQHFCILQFSHRKTTVSV